MGTSADYRFLEGRERLVQKLAAYQIYTMGDVARCSVGKEKAYHNEELLYKLFGINAELLIDHAWGYEPCTIADIKVYKPEAKSIGSDRYYLLLFVRKSKDCSFRNGGTDCI